MRRLLAWILSGVLILSLFLPALVLLGRAAAYTDWALTHNRERHRGTALTAAERVLYTTPAEGAPASLRATAREITAGLGDDTARLAAIYDWVCQNIAYDYDYFEGRSYTTGEQAGEVLTLRRAVCVGYAELTAQLCRAVGIPCKAVNGYNLSAGESWGEEHKELKPWSANHVWNEAYADGRWVILDTTWGSGNSYRDGVTTTGPSTREQFDLTVEALTESRLNIDYLSDGTFFYDQAADGSLTLLEPLDGALTQAVIPATVSGRPVVAVGDRAFEGCAALAKVTLPKSVTTLGEMAFSYTGLTAIPDLQYVTEVDGSLFAYCTSLTRATLPAHWSEIPQGIFDQCTNLEWVTLPSSITAVGIRAFAGCEKMVTFPFAAGLILVGKEAFAGSGLTAARLPDSVTTLGEGAFAGCRQLVTLTLPKGLAAIPAELAMGCSALTAVDIPAGVTAISHHAFQASGLRSAVLPAGLFDIREGTFDACAHLKFVDIPDRVTMIGTAAFRGCALEQLDLPTSLSTVGEKAFEGCGNLKEVYLPDRLSRIGSYAFGDCVQLQQVHIPLSLQAVGEGAFAGCDNLTAFTVDEESESFVAEEGVLYTAFPRTLLAYPAARPDTAYTVPTGVERIGVGAFQNARFLQTLRIEAALIGEEAIGGNAFLGATGLQTVAFASGTTAIPAYCFSGTGLTHITLPDTLQTLNLEAFVGCELTELDMPAGVEDFKPGSVALERLTVHPDNGLYYDVDGVLFRREDKALLWYPKGRDGTAYEVPAGIRYIGERAFADCRQLTAVTFPETLRGIRMGAFENCKLAEITLPAGLLELEEAFLGTSWWEAQPNGPVYLGDFLYAIKKDEESVLLEELTVREGTRVITKTGLAGCSHVKRLRIPASVEHIDNYFLKKDTVIEGYRGTAAETYAKDHRHTFVALDDSPATTLPSEAEKAKGGDAIPWVFVGVGVLAAVAVTGAVIARRKRSPKT